MGKNGFLERQRVTTDTYRQAEKETTIQYMTDTLILTLRDSSVMGKDTFGRERILKIIKAWGEKFDEYHAAIEYSDEADYYQEKIDAQLREFMGDDAIPFKDRYNWVKQLGYDKPVSRPKKRKR